MPRTADWFSNLSKKAQSEYLKAHPNSKYGKSDKKPSNATITQRDKIAKDFSINHIKGIIVELKKKLTIQKADLKKKEDALKKASKASSINIKTYRHAVFKQHSAIAKTEDSIRKAKLKLQAPNTVKAIKAHEVKRAADKNKVVAKTPSARKPVKKVMVSLTDFLANKRKAVDSKVKYARTQIEKLEAQIAKGTLTAVQKSAIRTKIKGLNERIKELKKPPAASKPSLSKISIRQKAMKK